MNTVTKIRRVAVSVGQPGMQREDGRFQCQPDGDERSGNDDRPHLLHLGEPCLHVSKIQRAGHHVDHADANQIKGSTRGTHDQVLE